MRRRIFSGLLSLIALFSILSQTALAAGAFSDVPEDAYYYESMEALRERHVIGGAGDGTFRPDDEITANALCIMCMRAFEPDWLDRVTAECAALDVLREENCVLTGSGEATAPVEFDAALGIIGRTAGIFQRQPVTQMTYTDKDVFRYMRGAGYDLDIFDIRDKLTTDHMTRGEAAYVIHSIMNWLESDETKSLDRVERYGFHYIDIQATEKYGHLLPELYMSVMKLPFEVLESFHDDGFRVLADNREIDEYRKTHDGNTVALFSRARKTIWTKVGDSLPHEFGHYVQYVIMNDKTSIEPYFKAEKDNLSKMMRVYAKTNPVEYFAEFFMVYTANRDNPGNLARLRADMPKTFDYFEKLSESNYGVQAEPAGVVRMPSKGNSAETVVTYSAA